MSLARSRVFTWRNQAQSSVTEQIQTLESEFGTALFDRSQRGLELTVAGRRLLHYADEILSLADEARASVADAANVECGRLAIGGLETLCTNFLPPLLTAFRQDHPGIDLQLTTARSRELSTRVENGSIDLYFTFGNAPTGSQLQYECVARERLVVLAPPDHRLSGKRTIEAADLVNETFLITEPGCVYRTIFDTVFPQASSTRPQVGGEFGSIGMIQRLVESGLGCALVPRSAVDVNSRAVLLPWMSDADAVAVFMVWRRRRVQSPVLRLFLDTARRQLGCIRPGDARHQHEVQCP